jgi:hypothetical protein
MAETALEAPAIRLHKEQLQNAVKPYAKVLGAMVS